MVDVTLELAERISEVARLLEDDYEDDPALLRLSGLGVELVPGATGAAVTITADGEVHTFAASDARIDKLHRLQFASGQGPVVETLRYNEVRHVRDTSTEERWRTFCRAAARAGTYSLIALPLHTGQQPAGAVTLYADRPGAFSGAAHDIALLFAAQGSMAVHNAGVYGACRQMVDNLQMALEARAIIEQAKGILHAKLAISPNEAFELLRRCSQNTNQKVRVVAARLVHGEIGAQQVRAQAS
jgi:transcriptional regulator with GAF, ATPase, and Fis domain